jgi:NitT/TauT family transport system ATP-binding protein
MSQSSTPALSVQDVHHWFGSNRVLGGVNFEVAAGQIVAVVGPSGCGKSTLLRAILGTHPPKQGVILASEKPITVPSRDIGIVYQHYSLYDFMTARENVAFGLKLDKTSTPFRIFNYPAWRRLRVEHLRAADELLEKVQLSEAAKLYPSEMSGGMRQRVAIAQSLILKPKVLLLDEPFGALDEATREELQLMLLRLYEENLEAIDRGEVAPYTIMMVTHELNEAIYVSDRVLGLSQYHAEGENGAKIVYDRPAPVFDTSETRDFAEFETQKDEIRRAVFDADHIQHHKEFVTFWDEHRKST